VTAGVVGPTGMHPVPRLVTRMDQLRRDWGHLYEIEDCGDHVRARRREPRGEWVTAAGAGYLRKAIEAGHAGVAAAP
jgi:hypothetical protein